MKKKDLLRLVEVLQNCLSETYKGAQVTKEEILDCYIPHTELVYEYTVSVGKVVILEANIQLTKKDGQVTMMVPEGPVIGETILEALDQVTSQFKELTGQDIELVF